jgi:hypothetical protein
MPSEQRTAKGRREATLATKGSVPRAPGAKPYGAPPLRARHKKKSRTAGPNWAARNKGGKRGHKGARSQPRRNHGKKGEAIASTEHWQRHVIVSLHKAHAHVGWAQSRSSIGTPAAKVGVGAGGNRTLCQGLLISFDTRPLWLSREREEAALLSRGGWEGQASCARGQVLARVPQSHRRRKHRYQPQPRCGPAWRRVRPTPLWGELPPATPGQA